MARGGCGQPQSYAADYKFSKSRNLTGSPKLAPYEGDYNLFSDPLPSSRKLEVLGSQEADVGSPD